MFMGTYSVFIVNKRFLLFFKVYSIYWDYSKQLLTMSNMIFNRNPISVTKNSAPWSKDMLDIALILAKILTKNVDFRFKNARIYSPLELFFMVNPPSNFPKIPKKIQTASHSSNNENFPYNTSTTSRVVAYFNEKFRFNTLKNTQSTKSSTHADVELGVPPFFNPNDENFSYDDLNEQLKTSIYDFIIR